jgi:predicted dehydrogenase
MSEDWTRRDFIRTGSALAAALAAGKAVFAAEASAKPQKPKAPKRAPATTQTKYSQVRLGIIGCGGKGEHNLNLMTECGATIAALCDVDTRPLEKAAGRFPNAKKYRDFRKLLESPNDIDAVVVSTPDNTHTVAAVRAMRLGKHLYCEKPLTHDIAEARLMMEEARKAKVATQMGNQGHSSEGSAQQVQWVKSGVIGAVKEVHIWTDRPIWPQGMNRPKDTTPVPEDLDWDLWLGPAPHRPFYNEFEHTDRRRGTYHPFNWRGWWDFGTGALGDMACHIMDAPYWALELRNPTAVEAFSDGGTSESPPKWSVIKYDFAATKDRPALRAFWYDGRLLPSDRLVGQKKVPGDGNGIIYVGEKGTIAAPLNGDPFIVQEDLAKTFTPPTKPTTRPGGADHYHHAEFLEACLGGPKPGSNFDYAAPLTEVVLLGNLAIRTGRRVEWDAANMKCTNVPEANQYVKREYRKGWEL